LSPMNLPKMIKGVLLDVGGVVAIGASPLPGAVDAIAQLRRQNIPVRFVTNITRQSHRSVVASLSQMGIAVKAQEVFTPSFAAREWLQENDHTPHLLIHPALEEDFQGLRQGRADTLVLGDAGDAFSYAALNDAFRVLANGGEFLALAQNRAFRDSDGELSLDAGAFVAALEFSSGKQALVLGKPAPGFFHAAIASIGCQPGEAVMVGDDAEFDVAAAILAGLSGILVRTGKYALGAELTCAPNPTVIADDIGAAVDWIITQNG
jgi:HAD superfamily hydrolase (TIGR01458 family)